MDAFLATPHARSAYASQDLPPRRNSSAVSVHICEGLARVSVLYGALPIVCIIPIPPLFAQVFFAERDSLLVEGILNARICQNINIALCHCYLLYDTPAIAL